MASDNRTKLDPRRSIVELTKLLGPDSGLEAPARVAQVLGYAAETSDPAAMNVRRHKQVMRKLAEHGGEVPDDLRA